MKKHLKGAKALVEGFTNFEINAITEYICLAATPLHIHFIECITSQLILVLQRNQDNGLGDANQGIPRNGH